MTTQTTMRAFDPDVLGHLVRDVWVRWAREQPDPKPSWLVPWEGLGETDKEVDRRIGVYLADYACSIARELTREALETDGAHHKQHLLMDIARALGIPEDELARYDPGTPA
jgi:hypothetical protein